MGRRQQNVQARRGELGWLQPDNLHGLAAMDPELQRLLSDVEDRTQPERQREAARQLWVFFQLKNRPKNIPGLYEVELPEHVRVLSLGEDEERALVAALHRLVASPDIGDERGSLLPPLSTAKPRLVIEPLLDLLICGRDAGWDDDDTYSLLIAFENALDVLYPRASDSFHAQAPHVVAAVRRRDPRPVLDELAASPNDEVAQIAQRLRQKVQGIFKDRDVGAAPS